MNDIFEVAMPDLIEHFSHVLCHEEMETYPDSNKYFKDISLLANNRMANSEPEGELFVVDVLDFEFSVDLDCIQYMKAKKY